MPNGFYFTIGFFTALLFAAMCAPNVEARRWARITAAGALIGGLIGGLIAAAIGAWL